MQTDIIRETDSEQSPHKLIASDRVEGTAVCEPGTGKKIGTIQRVMIDKLSGKVAYAVLTFGGFLGLGQRHYPVPWAVLTYDPKWEAYVTDITAEQVRNAPSYEEDENFDWGDRKRETELHRLYRTPTYWGAE
jgi:PRC-barrel domain protein